MRKLHVPNRLVLSNSTMERGRFWTPKDVRELANGKTILIELPEAVDSEKCHVSCSFKGKDNVIVNMQTRDRKSATARRFAAKQRIEEFYNTLRKGPQPISARNIEALAGDVYNKMIDFNAENPGQIDDWIIIKGLGRLVSEGRLIPPFELTSFAGPMFELTLGKNLLGDDITEGINAFPPSDDNTESMEKYYGRITNLVQLEKGVYVNAEDRKKLIERVHVAATRASIHLKRLTQFDYTPDPFAKSYPVFTTPRVLVTFDDMFDKWFTYGKVKSRSHAGNTRVVVDRLKQFFGDKKDVRDVSRSDAAAWRDWLPTIELKRPIQLVTVHGNYLVMAEHLYDITIRDGLQMKNPFKDMSDGTDHFVKQKKNPYSDDDVEKLLKIAGSETDLARRWLPLIAACTGARPGEILQLTKERVLLDSKVPYFDIEKADDRTQLKTLWSPRLIPIHPVLLTKNFEDFIHSMPNGPLFYKQNLTEAENEKSARASSIDDVERHPTELIVQHLARWIRRKGFVDQTIGPMYGFRHWWLTQMALIDPPDKVLKYLFGHKTGETHEKYLGLKPEHTVKFVQKLKIPGYD